MNLKAEFIRNLDPSYFAVVMATGIISNDYLAMGLRTAARVMFLVGGIAWVVVAALFIIRASLYTSSFWADLTDSRTMFSFFTFVAGTGVLGVYLAQTGMTVVASVMWVLSFSFWLLLTYITFSSLTLKNSESIDKVVSGGWLLLIVGTESVAILTGLMAEIYQKLASWALLLGFCVWGIGLLFYIIFIVFVVFRLGFFKIEANQLTPPYWINMGAAAITTVAGTTLYGAMGSTVLAQFGSGLLAASAVLWGWETWWLPLLVIFGVWRHFVKKHTLAYQPVMWSMVFVLGMYTKATWNLGTYLGIGGLHTYSSLMVWVAFAAWIFVAVNMLVHPKAR